MRRFPVVLALILVALVGLIGTGALAHSAQPPPDATPGSVGFGHLGLTAPGSGRAAIALRRHG